jgi:hypothetical protein
MKILFPLFVIFVVVVGIYGISYTVNKCGLGKTLLLGKNATTYAVLGFCDKGN